MKFHVFILMFVMVLGLTSCGGNVRNAAEMEVVELKKTVDLQKKREAQQQLITNKFNYFYDLIKHIPDLEMREEAKFSLEKIQIESYQSNKFKIDEINNLLAGLIANYPLQKHDALLFKLSEVYRGISEYKMSYFSLGSLIELYPDVDYLDEVYFRRAKALYALNEFVAAEKEFGLVLSLTKSVYYEQAVYMQAWSQYKQFDFESAVHTFMYLLDLHSLDGELVYEDMTKIEKTFVNKVMRGIVLSFDALAGAVSAKKYFSADQRRKYEYDVFISLAEYYLSQDELSEAVKTYQLFVSFNDLHIQSPALLLKAIDLYESGDFKEKMIAEKIFFVNHYHHNHVYWGLYKNTEAALSFVRFKVILHELADHFYAQAIRNQDRSSYAQSIRWQRSLLYSFPRVNEMWKTRIRLASLLKKSKQYELAAMEYERIAYDGEKNKKSAEAGYSALLMYEKREQELKGFEKKYWHKQFVVSMQRFISRFPAELNKIPVPWRLAKANYTEGPFDQAFKLVSHRKWKAAIHALETFQKTAASATLQNEVTKKLALLYLQTEDWGNAIVELEKASRLPEQAQYKLNMIVQAAELSTFMNLPSQAEEIYLFLIENTLISWTDLIDLQYALIELYERTNKSLLATQWRVTLVNTDAQGGKNRTEKSQYLATTTRMILTQPLEEQYRNVKLFFPLEDSLKIKLERFEALKSAYEIIISYAVPKLTSAARYKLAELYRKLGEAIIRSQKPSESNRKKLANYNSMLEEKAMLYTKQAIMNHQLNLTNKSNEGQDVWVKKSEMRLKTLPVDSVDKNSE